MKFDINFFLVFLLLAVLVLASGQMGCPQEEEVEFNTTALIMNFVENAPPNELVTGLKYPIYVDIKNLGGYDVPKGAAHFYLSGIGDNLENVQTHVQNVNFLNKRTGTQEGGQERISFATEAEPWKTLPAPFNLNIQIDSCYSYATITQTSICVGKGNTICSISGEKIETGSNSAAPIQISSLTESMTGNKLFVTFRIENKGLGEVYLPNTDCDKLQAQDINEKLKQNQVEISIRVEEGVTCRLQQSTEPYGTIDALDGITSIGQVTCQKVIEGAESHLSPFEIVLSYKYREKISKSITILPE
ncbi:MAG: hypothetical protein IB618_03720 [Candidatus Pacearchaeota archaeon]|nr:MAG: hypothetical protein IB618_03720 [Candidatus Pacearchaeota archaeon]